MCKSETSNFSKLKMDGRSKIIIVSTLNAEKYIKEVVNHAVESYITESDDEDLTIAICLSKLRNSPTRIENYIEQVVENYTACEFQQHFRVPIEAFEKLLFLVGSAFQKCTRIVYDSNILKRDLLAVIWLLATPDSYRSIGERFNMAKSTLSCAFVKIVDILNNLARDIIKWPDLQRMDEIEEGYRRMGGMRRIIGALDGTYIRIDAPREHAVEYINRKRYHSITLQAICDHTLKFTDCFVGYPSSVHDCRIFRNSDIYKDIRRNSQKYFPNNQMIIGDKAYPSLMWCLVPFKDNGSLTIQQKFFNQQHSKTRQTIERAFALLFGRFRRLKHLHMQRLDYIPKAVLAACVLHNICLDFSDDLSFMEDVANVDGESAEVEPITSLQENSEEALQLRERICEEL